MSYRVRLNTYTGFHRMRYGIERPVGAIDELPLRQMWFLKSHLFGIFWVWRSLYPDYNYP
ncbi:hypothetical protein [Nostoc commune]|uniref:hypothetical protein n=1 Tax=Nostoc commune TaxID=1178 RepID=UPI001E5E8A04|nr:hypothetical protein [Nostoc commune]